MTSGSRDVAAMVNDLEVVALPEEYVYAVVPPTHPVLAVARATIHEEEGITVVVRRAVADSHRLEYSFVAAWLTLTVHSSLEAVGLTAIVSTALADAGIACNMLAGTYHDHLLVPAAERESAIAVLDELREASAL